MYLYQIRRYTFSVACERVYMLPLKPDLYTQFPQVPDGRQQVYGVPGKTRDGFRQDNVDFSGFAVGDRIQSTFQAKGIVSILRYEVTFVKGQLR